MNSIKNQNGITLVEMIVSSAVSLVLGGVIYTLFMMYSNQSTISISSLLMHQQYDNVARQMSKDVRMASFVLGPGETPHAFAAGPDTVKTITMCNGDGTVLAQYAISGTNLTEGPHQAAFQSGGNVVTVVSGVSNFILDPQRRSVAIHLTLTRNDLSTAYAISARKDLFQCRNRS
ncbi:MAG: prepilin-type N-terminal cleavage/methylation domain-containing protein [Chitinispirillaceae bacterium]|nr:prepilin-type N-terminal cleavage/methylation domain-containing protein [Chitinispirillaceae bacterium]